MRGRAPEPAKPSEISPPEPSALQEGEDYYYDGDLMVFTEQYHRKRGNCCNSGCRHCPYK